ncbi:MAG: AMP-binding protein [Hydrogenophaga sp.]|uniref:acyl-CoA synthetase n=1 Tax=Hydrogenophaga sp. TaxID=1904254 RepID=UPI002607FE32|nr:AMP-binding protein [Hydrogenophaga sp.]MCW5668720.1 AMP-binding protein [Hydrogenophaga sp.]
MHGGFGWHVPERFNMAQACCGRWADGSDAASRVAVVADGTGLAPAPWSYAQLQQAANRLSNALAVLGVERGDRVAIVLPQRFETAVAYMAVLQLGAVAMPLSMLFGPEALEFRLHDSEAVVAICDAVAIEALESVRENCPLLRSVIRVGERAGDRNPGYEAVLEQESDRFTPCDTRADEAAVLIYTSGTTGQPKGALIAHRGLIGNLSGFVCSQNWFGFDPLRPGSDSRAVFWSPADWAWTGGLMDALLPTLYFGRPIVAWNGRFSPQAAFELMERHAVTHSFIFPTALKAMMKAYPEPKQQFRLQLQAIMSAGEAVGDAVFDYCRDRLGVVVNEMFGQTEINYIVGNCTMNDQRAGGVGWPAKPGSMGKGYPGHRVMVIDEHGNECPVGVPGDVAVNRYDVHGQPDPVFFLGYWKNPAATAARFTGDWCRTGDLATRDADGYLWYQGRADDVFKAAGYRIGPGEIENCLVKHPAVLNAAVVPKPDPERGALVKAYVVLAPDAAAQRQARPGAELDQRLVAQLQAHVRGKLAPYEYPKEIEFVTELPMTTTGKVQRRVLRLQEEARAKARTGV